MTEQQPEVAVESPLGEPTDDTQLTDPRNSDPTALPSTQAQASAEQDPMQEPAADVGETQVAEVKEAAAAEGSESSRQREEEGEDEGELSDADDAGSTEQQLTEADTAVPQAEPALQQPTDSGDDGVASASSASASAEQLDAVSSSSPAAATASAAAGSSLTATTAPANVEQTAEPEASASVPAQSGGRDRTESAAEQQLSNLEQVQEKEPAAVTEPVMQLEASNEQRPLEELKQEEQQATEAAAASAAAVMAEPTQEERQELLDALATLPLSPPLAETEAAAAVATSTDAELSSSSPSSSSAPLAAAADSDAEAGSLLLTATIPAPSPPAVAPLPREAMIHVRVPLSSSESAAGAESSASSSVLVPVLISRDYLSYRRPFLGGWKHHRTGIVKLNAETQTERRRTAAAGARREERETQTGEVVTRSVQTWREAGTQMERRDLYLGQQGAEEGQRVLQARDWVPSEVLESEREDAARRLQCWLRVCFSMRRMLQLKAERQQAEQETAAQQAAVAAQREAEQQQQVHRRLHPTSASDFRLLYAELRAWREHESSRISSQQSASAAEKQQQLSILLSKEVKLLQTIDRLKIIAAQRRQAAGIGRRLDAMSSPHEWTTSSGERLEVVTPLTVRSQQLISLYTALSLPGLAWDQRLDALIQCRHVVCQLRHLPVSSELVQLIDREQEWYGRRHASSRWQETAALAGLRRRLSVLFLSFIQHPEANPAAELYSQTLSREHRQRLLQYLHKPLPEREVKGKTGQGEAGRQIIGRVQSG